MESPVACGSAKRQCFFFFFFLFALADRKRARASHHRSPRRTAPRTCLACRELLYTPTCTADTSRAHISSLTQLVSNINAACALADTVRTTLGPRGMDKLIHDDRVSITEGVSLCASVCASMCVCVCCA
jgi:hypothetical protein